MSVNFIFRTIPRKDLPDAYRYYRDYTKGKSFDRVKRQYAKHPDLFVGCYRARKLMERLKRKFNAYEVNYIFEKDA